MADEAYSVVVIGSGFGGSIMSMVLRRLGKRVLLVERGKHPRFVIGESSTPFANLLLEKLAEQYDLPFLKDLSEWGSWQSQHPEIPAGLKRGFSFFHHRLGETTNFHDRTKQLLVAASPNDMVADTHWYRPDFDEFLVRKAVELGVEYSDETRIHAISEIGGGWKLILSRGGSSREVRAEFAIDATGGSSVLADYFKIPRAPFSTMPPTAGVWAHFRDVKPIDRLPLNGESGFPPYPPDDAAVHHVFDNGWIWVLRFNNGVTSAGAAFSGDNHFVGATAEETWSNLLNELPTVKELFEGSSLVTSFYSAGQLSFRRERISGPNWAMLPSTAGFVDPLLSTGFALNLLGIDRLAAGFQDGEFARYESQTLRELDAAADLVSALYAKMSRPEEFNLLTLLYFAALSFTETAWRLNKADLASGFLLTNIQSYSTERERLCAVARQGKQVTRAAIQEAIESFDIAGLTDWTRQNWYPVEFRDLINNAGKLQASNEELQKLFEKLRVPWPDYAAS